MKPKEITKQVVASTSAKSRSASDSDSKSESSSESSSESRSESSDSSAREEDTKMEKKKSKDLISKLTEALTRANPGSITINALKSDEQDVVDWFKYFDKCAKANDWSSRTKGAKVPLYFKGNAEDIWKDMKKADQYDYKCIKERLIKKRQKEDKVLDAANKFFNASQTENEPVQDFARRLRKYARQNGKISKQDVIGRM